MRLRRLLSTLLCLIGLSASWAARADTEVDLALVLAVDVSNSMDAQEQELQRNGFVAAFRSPMVHEAIRQGLAGRIAVTYVEWAGATFHHVLVPWTQIDRPEAAEAFADQLARLPLRTVPGTSISGAIDFSLELLSSLPFTAIRRGIDISGDGSNNQGRLVTTARDEAVARGVTINGLPIMLKLSGRLEMERLDAYYRDCVIGGEGAFMVPVHEPQQFMAAIRTKVIREIAGVVDPHPLIQPVRAIPQTDCVASESPWVQEEH